MKKRKSKKSNRNPNWKRFSIEYSDLCARSDADLFVLTGLISRLSNDSPPSEHEVNSMTLILERYIKEKQIREHLIFNRPITLNINPETIKAEKLILKLDFKNI